MLCLPGGICSVFGVHYRPLISWVVSISTVEISTHNLERLLTSNMMLPSSNLILLVYPGAASSVPVVHQLPSRSRKPEAGAIMTRTHKKMMPTFEMVGIPINHESCLAFRDSEIVTSLVANISLVRLWSLLTWIEDDYITICYIIHCFWWGWAYSVSFLYAWSIFGHEALRCHVHCPPGFSMCSWVALFDF